MKDHLDKYISRRKKRDAKFAENFENGYQEMKIGVLLRQAREKAGITQEDLARRTRTAKSAISRLENHAEDGSRRARREQILLKLILNVEAVVLRQPVLI